MLDNEFLSSYDSCSCSEDYLSENQQKNSCHKDSANKIIDVDEAINYVGQFGCFQRLNFAILALISLPCGYITFIAYFIGLEIPWECSPNLGDGSNPNIYCNLTGAISPRTLHYSARCSMPRNAWQFTKQSSASSFVADFDLVCDKEYVALLLRSAAYLGWLIGSMPVGMLCDKFGRKKLCFVTILLSTKGLVGCGLSQSPLVLGICLLLCGSAKCAVGLNNLVLIAEVAGPSSRALLVNGFWFSLSSSIMLLDLQAYLLNNWRYLTFVCSVPYIPLVFLLYFVPESMRWQITHGHHKEAEKTIKKMAKWNNRLENLPVISFHKPVQVASTSGSFIEMFKTKLIRRTLILFVYWFSISISFYSLSLATSRFGGNVYFMFAMVTLTEIPAAILAGILANRCGRKPAVFGSTLIAIVGFVILAAVAECTGYSFTIGRLCFGMIGKFAVTVAFNSKQLWTFELYPTSIRSQSSSAISILSRIATLMAPSYVSGLGNISESLPYAVLSVLLTISATASLFLPETIGTTLKDHYDQLSEPSNTSPLLFKKKIDSLGYKSYGARVKSENRL